jgi:hypothetical protein
LTDRALRQSLALWQRRLKKRQAQLAAAEQELEQARLQNIHPRQHLVEAVTLLQAKVAQAQHLVDRREGQLAALKPDADGFKDGVERVILEDAGPYVTGRPKLCWHSTEGSSVDGAIAAYRSKRAAPHFTIDPARKRLVQHISVFRSARALEHRPGTAETNRARTVQVEIVGFANRMDRLPSDQVAFLADLARWIERTMGIPSTCGVDFVPFPSGSPRRLEGSDWINYSGHLGHMHVPANSHEDPGALAIKQVLAH